MSNGSLPAAVLAHPRVGQWLGVGSDGRILVTSGKVDIGQGISHALRIIVAGELGVHPDRIDMRPVSTMHSPDEAVTSGSLSVQHSGAALRSAAAHLREACRRSMARRHGVDPAAVRLVDGAFQIDGAALSAQYRELVDAPLLAGAIEPVHTQARVPIDAVDRALPRADIAAKVFGEFRFIHDRVLPGMCHGRVFRPDTLSAQIDEAGARRLEQALSRLDGVFAVHRDGLLIGVLAHRENTLERAAKVVAGHAAGGSVWCGGVDGPADDAAPAWLKSQPLETTVVLERQPAGGAGVAAASVFRAEYGRPFLQHASIGLCCAIAQWHDGGTTLEVWSHSQGIFNLRRDLALAFDLPPHQVGVSHAEAAGCYGHNGADDVAFDAAWLARKAGAQPVRVQWSRQAEMGHAPMGPAMLVAIEASVGPNGRLCAWKQQVWSQGHGTRPGRGATPALLGAWQTAAPDPVPMAVNAPLAAGGGSERNAVPPYALAALTVLNHRVLSMPLRVSALRSLGAHANVFAAESMVDEIAAQLSRDPLAFRLAHLCAPQDLRAAAVLQQVARMANWGEARPAAAGFGRGIAFARYKNTGAYCAVVAELVLERAVRLSRLWIAADLGQVIDPDGARNQIEGGAIQAASWTLCECARFDGRGVRSIDWNAYPILRFSDVPEVQVGLIDLPDCTALGAGECSVGPTAAAIANAIANATGIRMRAMPFTAERLMQQAQAQGD